MGNQQKVPTQGKQNDQLWTSLQAPVSNQRAVKPPTEPPQEPGEAVKAELGLRSMLLSGTPQQQQLHFFPCNPQPCSHTSPKGCKCTHRSHNRAASTSTTSSWVLTGPAHFLTAILTSINMRNYRKHLCLGGEINAFHNGWKSYSTFSPRETIPLLYKKRSLFDCLQHAYIAFLFPVYDCHKEKSTLTSNSNKFCKCFSSWKISPRETMS